MLQSSNFSELQLDSALEELRLADYSEAVDRSVSVVELEADVVGEVPVHHRCEPPVLAALNLVTVEIDVAEVRDEFPCALATFKDRPLRRNLIEGAGSDVI